MRIAFFQLEPWEKEHILGSEPLKHMGAEFLFFDHALGKDHIPSDIDFEIASVFINSVVDEAVCGRIPKLKFVATRSTGYDHIDLTACAAKGIGVANVPSYGEHTIAEYTFALMLALLRKVYEGFDQIRKTGSFALGNLRGEDLIGKTLGVVGTGNIGRNVVRTPRHLA